MLTNEELDIIAADVQVLSSEIEKMHARGLGDRRNAEILRPAVNRIKALVAGASMPKFFNAWQRAVDAFEVLRKSGAALEVALAELARGEREEFEAQFLGIVPGVSPFPTTDAPVNLLDGEENE